MDNVIEFLEELGSQSRFKIDAINLLALLDNEDFDAQVKEAILQKDHKAIELMLNARSKIVCMLVPAHDDDEDEEDDDSEEITHIAV